MAFAEVEAPEPAAPPEPFAVVPPETEDFVVAAADPPEPVAPAFETPAGKPSQSELLNTMRKQAKRRQSGGRTVLWASLVTLVAVAVAAVVFRAEIARAWPGAAYGYAVMGLPVR